MKTTLLSLASLSLVALAACSSDGEGDLTAGVDASAKPPVDASVTPDTSVAADTSTPVADTSPSADTGPRPDAADASTPISDASTVDASTIDAARSDAGIDAAPPADASTGADGALPITTDAGIVYPPAIGTLAFTATGRDETRGAAPYTRGARVRLDWNLPGATSATLTGAGAMVVLESVGAPTFDDMGGGTVSAAGSIGTAQIPFAVNLLGDTWRKDTTISVSPKGVISRGVPTARNILDPVLPIPRRTPTASDWTDGTIAPFLDDRFTGVDANARITTKAFDAGLPTERFVAEWLNFSTGVDAKPRIAASMRVQAVVFANGIVEFRYGPIPNPGTATPLGDGAFLRGQGASIGLASSTGTAIAASQHVQSLDPSGTTFRFVPANALPPSGRGVFVLPGNAQTSLPLTITGSNATTATATLNVAADAYGPVAPANATFTSIRNDANVVSLAFGAESVLPLEVPFPLQVFGERWQSLAVLRNGAIGPWGVSVTGLSNGTNFDANPFPKSVAPNGFIAALYAENGSAWCAGGSTPTAFALVRANATPPNVTVEWPGLHKCGAQANGAVDVQVTIDANGQVVVTHGAVTPASGAPIDRTLFVGLENGAGNAARAIAIPFTSGTAFPGGRSFTFARP